MQWRIKLFSPNRVIQVHRRIDYTFVGFGLIEDEVVVDDVGLTLLVNFHKNLARSKIKQGLQSSIILSTLAEFKSLPAQITDQNTLKKYISRLQLHLSACICSYEILSKNEISWMIEAKDAQFFTESTGTIITECTR